MFNYKMVFWSEYKQRIRYTNFSNFEDCESYSYIGRLSSGEFDIFLEALFIIYEDNYISREEVQHLYDELRIFCIDFKNLKNGSLYE
jgi:hypothetical protein